MNREERDEQISSLAVAVLKTVPLLYRRVIRKSEMLAGSNMAYPKIGILWTLKRKGPLPLSKIAEMHSYSRQNLTTLTDRLEADGLVRRAPDLKDRRVTMLELTEEGGMYIVDHGERLKRELVEDLEHMDDDDIEALRASFETIVETIDRVYLKTAGARERGGRP